MWCTGSGSEFTRRVWERASVMCNQDGTERLGQNRLRSGCPLAWRTNKEDIHVRRLGDSDDLSGWHSPLDNHFDVASRVCFRRDRRQ